MKKITSKADLMAMYESTKGKLALRLATDKLNKLDSPKKDILICGDTGCLVSNSQEIIANLKAGSRKVLVILPANSDNIYLSSRNLPEVNVITVDEINTYAIMNANSLVMVDGVQDILAERKK